MYTYIYIIYICIHIYTNWPYLVDKHKKLTKKLSSHSWRSQKFMYHSSNVLKDITDLRVLTFQI